LGTVASGAIGKEDVAPPGQRPGRQARIVEDEIGVGLQKRRAFPPCVDRECDCQHQQKEYGDQNKNGAWARGSSRRGSCCLIDLHQQRPVGVPDDVSKLLNMMQNRHNFPDSI
jgi:hypothetical protein